jgi:hypothetical protein
MKSGNSDWLKPPLFVRHMKIQGRWEERGNETLPEATNETESWVDELRKDLRHGRLIEKPSIRRRQTGRRLTSDRIRFTGHPTSEKTRERLPACHPQFPPLPTFNHLA